MPKVYFQNRPINHRPAKDFWHSFMLFQYVDLSILSDQLQFLDQSRTFTPLVDHIKYITDIYCNATLQVRFESDVTAHGFPVSVESKTDQTGVLIEYRATRVTTGNIIICQEAKLQLSVFVGILAKVLAADQVQDFRLNPELIIFRILFFQDTFLR